RLAALDEGPAEDEAQGPERNEHRRDQDSPHATAAHSVPPVPIRKFDTMPPILSKGVKSKQIRMLSRSVGSFAERADRATARATRPTRAAAPGSRTRSPRSGWRSRGRSNPGGPPGRGRCAAGDPGGRRG